MKVVSSPLQIVDFAILNFEFNFIVNPPVKEDELLTDNFKAYDVNLDFGVDPMDDLLKVSMKADINRERELNGYSIFAECACIFRFSETQALSVEERNSLEGFSALYITLNTLRGFISNITANGPIGRYILPSIDLNSLINEKRAESDINKQKVVKKKGGAVKRKSVPKKKK